MLIEQEKSGGDASEATLSEIRDLLEQQIEFNETIWVDNTGTYYVRRVVYDEGTQTYTIVNQLPDGTPYSPTAPVEPASSGNDRELSSQEFLAIANGTGFSTGDTLLRTNVIDTLSATIVATIWFNQTTGSSIAAPTITDVEPSGLTRDILVSLGDQADAAYTTGSGSMISILKGIFGKLGTLGQKTMANSAPVVIASDQSTLPVSAASLPLPTGAATEVTLATRATEVTLDAVKTAVELVDDTIATDGGPALSKIQTIGGHTGITSHAWHVDASGVGRVDVFESDIIGAINETAPTTDTGSSGLNGRLQRIAQHLARTLAPASTQSTVSFYSAAAVTQDQNSAATGTTGSNGGKWIEVTNNSGVICDITVGGTSGGTDGTTILTVIAGDMISMPMNIAASAVLRIKPRSAALTSSDVVAVRVT